MLRKTKIISLLLIMSITASLVGCGKATTASSDVDMEELTVWSHLTRAEVDAIRPLTQKWGKENNIKVNLVVDKSEMQTYADAVAEGRGPDIVFGIAHDNLGSFLEEGLLSEVPNGIIDSSKYSSNSVLDAITINGKQVAIPLAQEVVALYYNKSMVSSAPNTMEELYLSAKEKGFALNLNDMYLAYGFLGANGGYVFGGNGGNLNVSDIGLNNEGAVMGLEFLNSLVQSGIISKDVTGNSAKEAFLSGKAAYYISGPWDISAATEAGLNFGVTPIPTLNGNDFTPLLGVQAGFVSSKCENKEKAWDLLKYMADNSGELLYENGNRIPVLNSVISGSSFASNEYMKEFSNQAKTAVAMPNIPEVQVVWGAANNALSKMYSGELSPQKAGDLIVSEIAKDIKK